MPVRLIALDIDGTLLDERSKLPEGNRQAIAAAFSKGIEIALVTGRRYDFAMPIARQLPCPITMIVNNGALVKGSDGSTYLSHRLPRHVARRVIDATPQFRSMTSVCFDRPQSNQVIFEQIDWTDPLRKGYFERNKDYIAEVCPIEDCLTEDPIQIMFTGQVNQARVAETYLRTHPLGEDYSMAVTLYEHRDFGLVDVLPKGCSKGATLGEWVSHRGWTAAEVMAIGDNLNDLEMLEYAGLPIVMGNCVPELKSFGWRETLTNDACGVAAAIQTYALGKA